MAELNLLIEGYELTEAIIFGAAYNDSSGKPRTVLVPKYVNQATGDIWIGRSSRPASLSDALMSGTWAENLLIR